MIHHIIFAGITALTLLACKGQQTESTIHTEPKAMRTLPVQQGFIQEGVLEYENGIILHLTALPFDTAKHTIGTDSSGFVRTIDARPFFGTDGERPRTELVSMSVTFDGRKIDLDVSGMFEPWNVAPTKEYFSVQRDSDNSCSISGVFSDAAGAYVAQWEIVDSGSIRTILTLADTDIGDIVEKPIFERDTTGR